MLYISTDIPYIYIHMAQRYKKKVANFRKNFWTKCNLQFILLSSRKRQNMNFFAFKKYYIDSLFFWTFSKLKFEEGKKSLEIFCMRLQSRVAPDSRPIFLCVYFLCYTKKYSFLFLFFFFTFLICTTTCNDFQLCCVKIIFLVKFQPTISLFLESFWFCAS